MQRPTTSGGRRLWADRSEAETIDRWKDKKASEEANARYNELLYYGLNPDE